MTHQEKENGGKGEDILVSPITISALRMLCATKVSRNCKACTYDPCDVVDRTTHSTASADHCASWDGHCFSQILNKLQLVSGDWM